MQSLDESTLESSPTTRPGWLQNNALGQTINPMLGWAVHKSYDAWKGFREPDGQKSWNGLLTGLAAYAAILPVGLAIATLRNKFDEDVLGKKQNIPDLTTVQNPDQALSMIMENTARVGTFGVIGEIPNYWYNQDTARPVSIDSRVFLVSTLMNIQRSIMNLSHQRSFDYDTVMRPFIQAVGGNGYLQYADMLNHTFSLDNSEARSAARISINNYLRVAGRELNLDVRTLNGTMQTATAANPVKPWVGKMVMAAYFNDRKGFEDAARAAFNSAKEMGKPSPQKYVVQAYEDSNPLRIVFKTLPSRAEYNSMLNTMGQNGQSAVASALRLYDYYGKMIGSTAELFGGERSRQQAAQPLSDEVLNVMIARSLGQRRRSAYDTAFAQP